MRIAALAVFAAWAVVAASYPGDLSRDDLAYLGSLEQFAAGFEARKDYGELFWGLLHLLGRVGFGDAWAEGRVGAGLSWLATLAVPGCAWVAARMAAMVSDRPTAPAWAAGLAAWSPAVLVGASSVGFGVRAAAVGAALLAVEAAAAWAERGRFRDAGAAVLLLALGLAIHPWALVGPLVGAPWLAWKAGTHAGRWRRLIGLAALMALPVAMVLTGQESRAAAGQRHLGEALTLLPVAAAAHGAWQLPGIGLLAPTVPLLAAAAGGLAIAGALLIRPPTRAGGLLVLGGLLAALPEAAAPLGVGADPIWTGNFVKATVAMALVAAAGLGVALGGLDGRHRRVILALAALAVVPRGIALVSAKAAVANEDAAAGRTVAALLRSADARDAAPVLLGDGSDFARASFLTRFVPELPTSRIPAFAPEHKESDRGYGGLDGALWQTSVVRCQLAGGGEGCGRPPVLQATAGCSLAFAPPTLSCEPPPATAPPADPAAAPRAALALLLLGLATATAGPWRRHRAPGTAGPLAAADPGQQFAAAALAVGSLAAAFTLLPAAALPALHANHSKGAEAQPRPEYWQLQDSDPDGPSTWSVAPGSFAGPQPLTGSVRLDPRDLDAAEATAGFDAFRLRAGSAPAQAGAAIPAAFDITVGEARVGGPGTVRRPAPDRLLLEGASLRLLLVRD